MTFALQEVIVSQKTFFGVMFIFILAGLFFSGTFSATLYFPDKESNHIKVMTGADFDALPGDQNVGYLRP